VIDIFFGHSEVPRMRVVALAPGGDGGETDKLPAFEKTDALFVEADDDFGGAAAWFRCPVGAIVSPLGWPILAGALAETEGGDEAEKEVGEAQREVGRHDGVSGIRACSAAGVEHGFLSIFQALETGRITTMDEPFIMSPPSLPPLTPETTLAEVLRAYPGAQRALFARYHIGGCSACAFQPTESISQVCARNDLSVPEVIEHIQSSHGEDVKLQISPRELADLMRTSSTVRVLDARTREEHEAVKIPGSTLMTQEVVQAAFNSWPKDTPVILYDHTGSRSMDVAAYFIGHGFTSTQCLAGGIDAYSQEIDPKLPRYRVEIEQAAV
jgi:rhodanese-related sulfurtransferase